MWRLPSYSESLSFKESYPRSQISPSLSAPTGKKSDCRNTPYKWQPSRVLKRDTPTYEYPRFFFFAFVIMSQECCRGVNTIRAVQQNSKTCYVHADFSWPGPIKRGCPPVARVKEKLSELHASGKSLVARRRNRIAASCDSWPLRVSSACVMFLLVEIQAAYV